jgi:hypothetical protein
MDLRFTNQTLQHGIDELTIITPKIEPTKGSLGGFSIDFISNSDTNTSENLLYRDEKSRDKDFDLLTEYLNRV